MTEPIEIPHVCPRPMTAVLRHPSVQMPFLKQSRYESDALAPVFRMSPYAAEERRKRRGTETAQILFLDEGNDCRSLLGAHMLQMLVQKTLLSNDVTIRSASIGPTVPFNDAAMIINVGITHFSHFQSQLPLQVLEEMELQLGENVLAQSGRVFDQEIDPIDSDLILVMDRFDREEVSAMRDDDRDRENKIAMPC